MFQDQVGLKNANPVSRPQPKDVRHGYEFHVPMTRLAQASDRYRQIAESLLEGATSGAPFEPPTYCLAAPHEVVVGVTRAGVRWPWSPRTHSR
jgi:hypothetical protein